MTGQRKTAVAGSVLLGLVRLLYVRELIRFWTGYPPEQVHLRQVSPDGSRIALFSVRYPIVHRLVPTHVSPDYYLTIVDVAFGRVLFRGVIPGTLRESFLALAQIHAPWATEAVKSAVPTGWGGTRQTANS